LTQRRADNGQSWLGWLRQMPQATTPAAMLGLIERLKHVRAIGIDTGRGHRVHQTRLTQLAVKPGGRRPSISPTMSVNAVTPLWSRSPSISAPP
jgi:hypothetical protein